MVLKYWMGNKMKVKIIGKRKLRSQLKEMSSDLRRDLAKQMRTVMPAMERDAIKRIDTGTRTGRPYTRNGRTRIRSAPGEFPKTDTGDLVSKFSNRISSRKAKVIGFLENSSDHAAELEFSPLYKGGRPFMRPLYHAWQDFLRIKFQVTIKNSLRKNSK